MIKYGPMPHICRNVMEIGPMTTGLLFCFPFHLNIKTYNLWCNTYNKPCDNDIDDGKNNNDKINDNDYTN